MVSSSPFPTYPSAYRIAIRLAPAMVFRLKRSFRQDALSWVKGLQPEPVIIGKENIPQNGPFLLVINHYNRPKFNAWWFVLSASATIPIEIHWIMAAAWTFPNHPLQRYLEWLSRYIFRKIAQVYNFTLMPPMPPRPWETQARALAVRSVIQYAHNEPKAALGLAPEGGDSLTGILEMPAPGVGRFILHLANLGLAIHPLGIYESEGALHLRFGPILKLDHPPETSPDSRDCWASQITMQAIAKLLPAQLRGTFSNFEPFIIS